MKQSLNELIGKIECIILEPVKIPIIRREEYKYLDGVVYPLKLVVRVDGKNIELFQLENTTDWKVMSQKEIADKLEAYF